MLNRFARLLTDHRGDAISHVALTIERWTIAIGVIVEVVLCAVLDSMY